MIDSKSEIVREQSHRLRATMRWIRTEKERGEEIGEGPEESPIPLPHTQEIEVACSRERGREREREEGRGKKGERKDMIRCKMVAMHTECVFTRHDDMQYNGSHW